MRKVKYRSNNIVFNCRYHVVFCPKRRKKVLVGDIAERLNRLVEKTCESINVDLLAIEIMPDHVHLVLSVDPQFGINKAMKRVKGVSSRYLREEYPELKKLPSLWT